MREFYSNHFFYPFIAITASLFALACGAPPQNKPYADPANTLSALSNLNQGSGCNGNLFSIRSQPGFNGNEYDPVGQNQYNICVTRTPRSGVITFSISGTTTALGGRACIYPMNEAVDGTLTPVDNVQCFQVSNGRVPGKGTFNDPSINYVVIADAQYSNQMFNPLNPYESCLSDTAICPSYAEGPIQ